MGLHLGIAGADTLLGKEVGAALPPASSGGPWGDYRLRLLAGASAGAADSRRMVEFADEPALLDPLTAEKLAGLDVVFFAGRADETRQFAPGLAAARALVVDLLGALPPDAPGAVVRVPHPVAQALAATLAALARCGDFAAAATILEPASERGWTGIEELRAQSLQLLAVKAMPTEVFGAQIAYNLLPELPAEISPSLGAIASAIAGDLRALAGPAASPRFPLPALRLLQAPLFHAQAISLALRFAAPPDADAWLRAAADAGPALHLDRDAQPDVVGAAGEHLIQVGPLQLDPLRPDSAWLFLTVDNLRLRATTAVALAASAVARLDARS